MTVSVTRQSNTVSHVFQHNHTELSLIERLLGIVREEMLGDGLGFFLYMIFQFSDMILKL